MGPYERQKREQQRAREREARRSELVGLGTPVSQTRVAPVINRSPYEGVRIGNSRQGSYQYGKDMREKGFVEKRDINGNIRWVNQKTGLQPDGSPLNPVVPSAAKSAPKASGVAKPGAPVLQQARQGVVSKKNDVGPEGQVGPAKDLMDGRLGDVPDLNRLDRFAENAFSTDMGFERKLRAPLLGPGFEAASMSPGEERNRSEILPVKGAGNVYTDENGVTYATLYDEPDLARLDEKEAELQKTARLAEDFNAYKKVTEKQNVGLTEVQKSANDLEKPGVSEANRQIAQTETNIGLLQREDELQKQRDAAEIAQIMGDSAERKVPEEDQNLQNPADKFITAGRRQQERQAERDRNELSTALASAEGDNSAAQSFLNGHTDVSGLASGIGQENAGANIEQAASSTLSTLGIERVGTPPPQMEVTNNQQGLTEDEKEDQAAAKGGEEDRFAMSRNFLATDKVPDSIFGYPIASREEDYTPGDIEFFRAHPEAGGYYDLGEGSPEDGTEEGAPVQDDEPVGKVSPEQKIVDDAWDRVSAQVGEDHLSDLANTFKVLSGEGSFSQPGASLAQVSNGHKARLAIAMNDAARKTANAHNNGRVYKPYTTLTNSSDVISGTAKDQAASTNWFDTATGRPRSHLAAGNLKLAEAIAQTIKDAGSFVLDQFQNPTNLLPARAVSYGDGRNGLGRDRVEIQRGPLPGSVRLDLPPGFRVGEDPNDPRRAELLRREGGERRMVEANAVRRGLAILFPEGRTVGSVLKAHKVDLGTVRKLNPGFNDRNVRPGQFIWIKNPDNDHDK